MNGDTPNAVVAEVDRFTQTYMQNVFFTPPITSWIIRMFTRVRNLDT